MVMFNFHPVHTVPGLEHGKDEEVVEADLRLRYGAGGPVELRHDDR